MENVFIKDLNVFRNKCDEFFNGGECERYFDSFGVTSVMGEYYKAFLRQCEGGKRVRAYLTYLGYKLCGGKDDEKVFLPSLSYELFQTGILAHDDIIDNSDTRRFKPSMHIDLGGGHGGVSKSICTGDFGIVAAVDIVAKSDFDDRIKLSAIAHQNKVFISTIAGELKDIEFSGRLDVLENEILGMNLLKTAQYTVSGPLVLGAILADADEKTVSKLYEFGNLVGVAFQIRDDILGMFAEEAKVGKPVTADMCEGKQTVLTSYFNKIADAKQKEEFLSVYGKDSSGDEELKLVRQLLTDSGALKYAESMCKNLVDKAAVIVDEMVLSDENREKLYGLLEYMTKRNN